MRVGPWLALSVSVNLLLWMVLSQTRAPEVDPQPTIVAVDPAPPTPQEPSPEDLASHEVARFTWAMLEPHDLRRYVTNLHAIGCPDDVVDWIAFEYLHPGWVEGIDRILVPVHARFFDLVMEAEGELWNLAKPQQKELEEWSRNCDSELESVLGRPVRYSAQSNATDSRVKRHIDYLTQEQARKAFKIYDSYGAGLRDSKKSFAEKQEIRRKRSAELSALTSPEAAEEFVLRESDQVWSVQSRAFADRPGEMRAIVSLMEAAQAQAGSDKETDRLFMEMFKQTLGEERWEDYKLAQDHDYQGLWEVASQEGAPAAKVKAAYEVRKQAQADLKLLREAAQRDPLQAVQLRQEWRVRTIDGLLRTLGPELAQRYLRQNNRWLAPDLSVRKRSP